MSTKRPWRGWNVGPCPQVTGEGPEKRERKRARAEWRERRRARETVREFDSELFTGQRDLIRDEAFCTALFERATEGAEGLALKHRHNFLVQGLARGCREKGWQLPCPAPLVLIHAEPPPFDSRSARIHAWLTRVDAAHRQALRDAEWRSRSGRNPYLDRATFRLQLHAGLAHLAAGRILYQAIRYGGLLARPAIKGLGRAALKTLTLDRDGRISVEIPLAGSQGEELPPRRFYPDPVTGLLLLGFQRHYEWPDDDAERLVWLYMRGLGIVVRKSGLLGRISEGSALALQLETFAPPYLVRYARTAYLSPSLPRKAWLQMMHGHLEPESRTPVHAKPPIQRFAAPAPTRSASTALAVRRAIRSGLKSTQRALAREDLETFLKFWGSEGTLPTWLAEWARQLLAQQAAGGRFLRVRTVRTYLSAIAAPLECELRRLDREHEPNDPLDMTTLTESEWQALYDNVLANAPRTPQQTRKAYLLADLHDFIRCSDPNVPTVDIERPAGGPGRIDVDFIAPPAFLRAAKSLCRTIRNERTRDICQLMMVLGYRLGLRRGEIAGLSLADVVTGGLDGTESHETSLVREPQLHVRTNHFHALKTEVRPRHLPLAVLLTAKELRHLLNWCAERYKESTVPPEKARLFTLSATENHPVPEALFTRITHALQVVCGNRAVRFHHLRHSLASLLALRCLPPGGDTNLPASWRHQGHRALLPLPDGSLPGLLLGRNPGPVSDSRRVLQLIGRVLGHIDLDSTVGSYIHTFDQLMGNAVAHYNPKLSPGIQAMLLEANPPSRYQSRWQDRHAGTVIERTQLASDVLTLLARQPGQFKAQLPVRRRQPLPSIKAAALEIERRYWETNAPPPPILIYQLLSDCYQGFTHAEVARRHAVTESFVARLHTAARARFERHITRKGRYRLGASRRDATPATGRKPALPGLCPAPPRSDTDMREALRQTKRLLKCRERDRDRLQGILHKYLDQTTYREPDVTFQSESDFLEMIWMLDQAEIDRRRIRLRVRPSMASTAPPTAEQFKYWADALGLPRDQVFQDPDKSQSPTTRHAMGRAKLLICSRSLKNPRKANWEELRFAIFCFALICDIQA